MTTEIEENGRDQTGSGHGEKEKIIISQGKLYRKFELLLLDEKKKSSSSEKSTRKMILPECMRLSRNMSSSNKIEPRSNQNDEPGSSKSREFFREVSKSDGSSKVYGFENEVLSLENVLLRSGRNGQCFKAIGVVGTTGVGKTALCQEIFKRNEVKNHFLPRIWVCMSRKPNDDENSKIGIVKRILQSLGVEEEIINFNPENDQQLRGLLYALRLQLIGKRYLIVLDDCDQNIEGFREEQYYCLTNGSEKRGEHLSYGLPKGYGGTVIVTSRSEELAKKMIGVENLRTLAPLSDPESCWLIYRDSIRGEGVEFNGQSLKELKDELTKRCGGLPLAAKLMGHIKAQQLRVAAAQSEATENATKQTAV